MSGKTTQYAWIETSHKEFNKKLPNFETRHDARDRKRILARLLDRSGDDAAKRAAHKLRSCRKEARCGSPICPVCVRSLRRRFVEHGWACLFDFCWAEEVSEDVTAFSFALPEEQYAVGELHKANLPQINKRLQRRYERAGLPLVLGGVDISLNEDSAGRWFPYWQLQVYGVTVDLPLAEVKKRLAVNLPISERIPRPLRVRDCIEIHQGLSYIIKPMFIRRVSYVDPTGRLNTRKVPIKSAEMRELAVWLDQYPLTARYLLIGCRRYEDRIEPNKNRRTNP